MKKRTMKASLPAQLRHAVKMVERLGHQVHIKNQLKDKAGNMRYYFTLLKPSKKGKTEKFTVAKRTFASVFGATVKLGKHHSMAWFLDDNNVRAIPYHHCQRMTVIM